MKTGNDVRGAVALKGRVHVKKKKAGNNVCGAVVLKGRAHVKKKKARNGVCGAIPAILKPSYCTRQKEKSKKWRVRSSGAEGARTRQKGKSNK